MGHYWKGGNWQVSIFRHFYIFFPLDELLKEIVLFNILFYILVYAFCLLFSPLSFHFFFFTFSSSILVFLFTIFSFFVSALSVVDTELLHLTFICSYFLVRHRFCGERGKDSFDLQCHWRNPNRRGY